MRFTIEKDTIIEPLSRVASVIDSSPTIPILAQVLIESVDGGIRLWGSSIDLEASERIEDVEVSAEGKFVCSAQMLLEYCRRQPSGSRLDFNQAGTRLVVENIDSAQVDSVPAANANGSAPDAQFSTEDYKNAMTESLLDAEDFPYLNVGEEEWTVQFDMDRYALRNIFRRTEHAMGKNEPRHYLNATLLEIADSCVRAVTTDGHRMAMSESNIDAPDLELRHRAVVPRKTAIELSKVLSSLTSRVTVQFKSAHLRMSTPNFSFTSKLMEGAFPDWRAAVPGNLELAFRADRSELASGLNMVGILGMAHKDPNKGKIAANVVVSNGRLDMVADIVQKKIEHTMNVDENISEHKFQVNYRYLLDALEAMPECENVELYLRATQSACQIKFPEEASTTFLVMLLKDT